MIGIGEGVASEHGQDLEAKLHDLLIGIEPLFELVVKEHPVVSYREVGDLVGIQVLVDDAVGPKGKSKQGDE